MNNGDGVGVVGITTRGLDGKNGDSTELERLRLIIQSQQSELIIERQKCEDFRYQNLRLRMRVASLEDMLDARGIFYERPQDDFIYRDGTKFNVASTSAKTTNVLYNEKNLQEENDHLKKENEALLARYRMYYQKNEALTIENEELKRKNSQTSGPTATPSTFSVWPFSSSGDTPSSQPTPKPTPVASGKYGEKAKLVLHEDYRTLNLCNPYLMQPFSYATLFLCNPFLMQPLSQPLSYATLIFSNPTTCHHSIDHYLILVLSFSN